MFIRRAEQSECRILFDFTFYVDPGSHIKLHNANHIRLKMRALEILKNTNVSNYKPGASASLIPNFQHIRPIMKNEITKVKPFPLHVREQSMNQTKEDE